jgi:5-methylcytosine-specific restriction protein A
MPRAPKVCSHVDAAGSCSHVQPCPDHARKAWEGSTRRTELPSDWDRRRRAVLRRDEFCTLGTHCGGLALAVEVHHRGDKHDHRLESLGGVCVACHRAATQAQAAAARATSRA